MKVVKVKDYRHIVILTGAGISVASGIPPFRGPNGIWNKIDAERLNAQVAMTEPGLIWSVFGPMRDLVNAANPNPGHLALAHLEKALNGSRKLTLITQNLDGLHQRAGNKDVIELHGCLNRTYCSNKQCHSEKFMDNVNPKDTVPHCRVCGAHLLPDVVLFHQLLPVDAEYRSKRALRECDLFLAIGTSGSVSPASNFVRSADYSQARTILVNLESPNPRNPYFHEEIIGRAEDVLPKLFDLTGV